MNFAKQSRRIGFFFGKCSIYAIIKQCLGDLNDGWKEYTQSQISAHAMGGGDYHARGLAYVRPEMQYGDTRLLTENQQLRYDIM